METKKQSKILQILQANMVPILFTILCLVSIDGNRISRQQKRDSDRFADFAGSVRNGLEFQHCSGGDGG